MQLSHAMFYGIHATINSLQDFENMAEVSTTNFLEEKYLLELSSR